MRKYTGIAAVALASLVSPIPAESAYTANHVAQKEEIKNKPLELVLILSNAKQNFRRGQEHLMSGNYERAAELLRESTLLYNKSNGLAGLTEVADTFFSNGEAHFYSAQSIRGITELKVLQYKVAIHSFKNALMLFDKILEKGPIGTKIPVQIIKSNTYIASAATITGDTKNFLLHGFNLMVYSPSYMNEHNYRLISKEAEGLDGPTYKALVEHWRHLHGEKADQIIRELEKFRKKD